MIEKPQLDELKKLMAKPSSLKGLQIPQNLIIDILLRLYRCSLKN